MHTGVRHYFISLITDLHPVVNDPGSGPCHVPDTDGVVVSASQELIETMLEIFLEEMAEQN